MRKSVISRLILVILAGGGLVVAGAPPSQGADPFAAGGRSTRSVALDRETTGRAIQRAVAIGRSLGLPGVSHRAERLDDRFDHRTYDEVVAFDAAGREVAVMRLDKDGRVVMAIRLGWPRAAGTVGDAAAESRSRAFAAAAGIDVRGPALVTASAGSGGWAVAWPRVVDGVPALGDGVRVSLFADGSFHSVTRTERPLAAAPQRRLSPGAAREAAVRIVEKRFGGASRELRVVATSLAWVAPNDTWSPERPDAPAATLRLAWIVRLEAAGSLAERLRMIEYWIDAGDGSLLGGDVAE